jgi:hypothetical protein
MRILSDSPTPMRRAVGLALAMAFGYAGALEAQRTISGFTRSDQSDVSGVIVTTGDQTAPMFAEPGSVRSMTCPVAWGVRTAAARSHALLLNGGMASTLVPERQVEAAARQHVLGVLTSNGNAAEGGALLAALAPHQNRGAASAARTLVHELRGLLLEMERIDPARAGAAGATRLARSVSAYNDYIEASGTDFLASPPPELRALHSALHAMVSASFEHEGRVADVTSVDADGLACAPPFLASPPPVETPLQLCVATDRSIRYVSAVVLQATGDSLAVVGGERVPLAEAYPAPRRPNWLTLGEPVHIGATEYQQFGISRSVHPGELGFAGEAGGIDYYVTGDEAAPPMVIYFPVGPACEMQPYRSVESIRVRG